MAETMTRGEREDLQRLLRQREKVQKSAAKQRSTELMADFENQMSAVYHPDDDPIWHEMTEMAEAAVRVAQTKIQARSRELGIAKGCEPNIHLSWEHRGYSNTLDKRRTELRISARARIAAIEQEAIVKIELASVDAQTQLAVAGLTSDAARTFVDKLPTIESLMPALSFREFAGEADPPVAEQLTSPNTLRQRRFRERQKMLAENEAKAAETAE